MTDSGLEATLPVFWKDQANRCIFTSVRSKFAPVGTPPNGM